MKTEKLEKLKKDEQAPPIATGAAAGAAAGAALGAFAGPAGAAIGAIAGAAAGAGAGKAMHDRDVEEAIVDQELDETIGVTEGSMGAPNLKHPPAKVGAYSRAASGGGSPEANTPAQGPIPKAAREDT